MRTPLLLALSGVVVMSASAAEGTRLLGAGAAQMGTAGAGVASPQDANWIALNPAGLVHVTNDAVMSCEIINGRSTETPRGALGNTAAGTMTDSVVVFAPSVAWVRAGDGQALALGFYTVSGLALELPAARSSFGAAGGYDRRAEERFVTTSVAYARTVADGLSFGVALNFDYADFRSDSMTLSGGQTAGAFTLDRSLGGGFSLSVLQRWQQVSVAATYTSRQWMQGFDRYADLFAGTPDQPQVIQLGVAWRPLPWLEPLLDYRFIDWDSLALFHDGTAKSLGWRDQHIIKLACNVHVQTDLVLRAGVSYGRSPITESVAFTNGLTNLVTEMHATIGVGWKPSPACDVQIAYMHAFKNEVTDNGDDAFGLAQGTSIGLEVDSLTVGVGWLY